MPKRDAQQLYELYKRDKLVVHTMPMGLIDKRPVQHQQNKSSMMCGSLLFYSGIQHQNGHHIPNAVARFGPDKHDTTFATLHDLDAVYDTHQQLESQKPKGKRGEPFVLFANSDIGNMLEEKKQQPPCNYMECIHGECPPIQCERGRGFDFRGFCSTKNEKEDPSMEEEGNEWNELRAVLNDDNMVGLLYIHDPQYKPQQHVEAAKKLSAYFNDEFLMLVFKLREPGGHQGDLLVMEEKLEQQQGEGQGQGDDTTVTVHTDDGDIAEAPAGSARVTANGQAAKGRQQQHASKPSRLVMFEEYLNQQHLHGPTQ